MIKIRNAYGRLKTDKGGSFDLEGDHFIKDDASRFPIGELPLHLQGLKVLSIGKEAVEEAHVLINGDIVLDSPEAVNQFFGL